MKKVSKLTFKHRHLNKHDVFQILGPELWLKTDMEKLDANLHTSRAVAVCIFICSYNRGIRVHRVAVNLFIEYRCIEIHRVHML